MREITERINHSFDGKIYAQNNNSGEYIEIQDLVIPKSTILEYVEKELGNCKSEQNECFCCELYRKIKKFVEEREG